MLKNKVKQLVKKNAVMFIDQIFDKRNVILNVDEDEHPALAEMAREIDKDILKKLIVIVNTEGHEKFGSL